MRKPYYSNLVRLNVPLQRIKEPFAMIEKIVEGKNVLNIGAAGGVEGYLPHNKKAWLHEKIKRKAKRIVGVDIDQNSIQYAQQYGYEILNQNCETMELGKIFDVIVMSDVIEHVDAPVAAIENLMTKHLIDDGALFITTPNATASNILFRTLFRRKFNVLNDHVTVFYPENFKVICDRLGVQLTDIYMFDHIDHRSFSNKMKSFIFQFLTLLSPRLSSSMLVVIKK